MFALISILAYETFTTELFNKSLRGKRYRADCKNGYWSSIIGSIKDLNDSLFLLVGKEEWLDDFGISDIFQDSAADNLLRAIRYLSLDLCLDLRRMGVNAIVLELGLEVSFLW